MKPSKDLGGFVVFDNLERYRMSSYQINLSIAIVGKQFVDYSGLTLKSIFINKDTNKRCESKAQSYKCEARQPAPISPLYDKGHKYKCNDEVYKYPHNKNCF